MYHKIPRSIIVITIILLTMASRGDTGKANPVETSIGVTKRVSVSSDGIQGNRNSSGQSISANGRYVVFGSNASNLVPDDTNDEKDIFFHDRQTGVTERVSVASDGTEGNSISLVYNQASSADGRYVHFYSFASNLVPGDTNDSHDAFVHDRHTGITERVSVSSDGIEGNGFSGSSAISADGRYVAIGSQASNLVPGDTNDVSDAFIHDRQTGIIERVSVSSDGIEGNSYSSVSSISADGRFVAFGSNASNLVPDDTNDSYDAFVHDRHTGITERVSVSSDGIEGNEESRATDISADGRFVVFFSFASNLVNDDFNDKSDVFVHDRQTDETERISVSSNGVEANGSNVGSPRISAHGRFVTFDSYASNLVWGDRNNNEDVFMHDRQTGDTIRISVASDGTEGISWSSSSSISDDGREIAFISIAYNLVDDDTNDVVDVFVHSLPALCEISYYSQRDPNWANHPLRTAGICSERCATIGSCGCTLTSTSMLFTFFGVSLKPDSLSDCMGNQACPFHWDKAASCASGKVKSIGQYPFSYSQLEQEIILNQRPVILGMYRKGNELDTHWVLVISGQGDSASGYYVHDPWPLDGDFQNLSVLERDNYIFNKISVYSGESECESYSNMSWDGNPISPSSSLRLNQMSNIDKSSSYRKDQDVSANLSGSIYLFKRDYLKMTLRIIVNGDFGDISEIRVWTDSTPNSLWQPFAEFVSMEWYPEDKWVYVKFRDIHGNVSEIMTDSIRPLYSPPSENYYSLYVPIIMAGQ